MHPHNGNGGEPRQVAGADTPHKPRRDDTVVAVLALLAENWPKCFSVYEKRRRPLKIGIHHEILAAIGGVVTSAELSRGLRAYVGNKVYRSRLVAGAVRVGLDGEPAGEVTAGQAAASSTLASSSPASPASSCRSSPTPPTSSAPAVPPRLSLADLRAAARRRRAESKT